MRKDDPMEDIIKKVQNQNFQLCTENDKLNKFNNELIEQKLELVNQVVELRKLVYGYSTPTIPEYKEHHEQIQKILNFIDEKILIRFLI